MSRSYFCTLLIWTCAQSSCVAASLDESILTRRRSPMASPRLAKASFDAQKTPIRTKCFVAREGMACLRGGASESASAWNVGSDLGSQRGRVAASGNSFSGGPRRDRDYLRQQGQRDAMAETKEAFADAFLERSDRNRFIARVYAVLTAQLLFTAGVVHALHLNSGIRDWMLLSRAGRKVPVLGLIISTLAWWTALHSEYTRQSSPFKWLVLVAFTIGESITVGFISAVFAYATILKATVATSLATLSVTIYTLLQKNPKYDLTQWGRALLGLGVTFTLYGFLHILQLFGFIPHGLLPYTEALYCTFGAGLFSLYLAHHTRLIVSGTSTKYQLNEKDYILGAMSLYNDVINIFLFILRVLGDIEDR